jgi:hypothetical protein
VFHRGTILAVIAVAFFASRAYSYDFGGIKLNVIGEAGETYDDNITYADTNTKKDFITNLTGGLLAEYTGRSSSASFVGNVTQQIFAYHPNYSNLSEDATIKFNSELTKRARMSIKDVLSHTYEYRSFDEAFGAPGGRYSYFRNRFYADLTMDLLKQLALILRYQNNIDLPSRKEISDSYYNLAGAELDYYITSKTIAMGTYSFSIRKFDPGRDATTQSMGGGVRQYMTDQLYFDLKAAFDYLVSYDDTRYYKPMFSASLTGELDKRTTATISFDKQYYTNSYSQDLFDYWQISANFARQIWARLKFFAAGFYGNGRYIAQGIQDNLFGLNASIEYELTRRAKARIAYSFSKTDSDQSSRNYTKNTAYAGLRMEF